MEKYCIFIVEGGLGKNIAATAVAEAINKNYPDRKLIILTPYPEVFLNNPFVYRVYKSNALQYFYIDFIKNKDTIFLGQEVYKSNQYVKENKHLIISWCEMYGIKYDGEKPNIFLTNAELIHATQKFKRNRESLILQSNGGPENNPSYCWARDIPQHLTANIINILKEKYHIFYISHPNQISFNDVEKINLPYRELFCFLAISSNRILIDSFAQHASAAFMLKSTVLWIGTSPNKLGYKIHKNITPKQESEKFIHYIDGIFSETEFSGISHQCNLDIENMFDINEIIKDFV